MDPAHTGRFMPVRAIQKKWAPRAVLFPWEIGGYMALAVLIAVMANGLAWALDIGVAVLAGAAAACIVAVRAVMESEHGEQRWAAGQGENPDALRAGNDGRQSGRSL